MAKRNTQYCTHSYQIQPNATQTPPHTLAHFSRTQQTTLSRYWAQSYQGQGDDVPAGDRTATVGEGERDDGDRGAGGGAERAGGADRAVHEDAEGDPGGAGGRGLPEGRGELHHAKAHGVPGGAGLGGHREAPRLWPGRGAHRGGSRRAHSHRQNDRSAHFFFFFFFENLFLNLFSDVDLWFVWLLTKVKKRKWKFWCLW